MFVKAMGLLTPLAMGGLWFGGALGGGDYSRVVDRPRAEVMSALEDLDVRTQPGQPGTDPSASGGIAPLFLSEHVPDGISFIVMSGDKVATRMTAHLEAIDGGRRTRVTATVERGDAPDDFVSPAFRSRGITLGLFSAAIEGELNELVAPPRLAAEECADLEQRLLLSNVAASASGSANSPGLSQAVGGTARTAMGLYAVEAELRRRGCDTGHSEGGSEPIQDLMSKGGSSNADAAAAGGVNFAPGEPMVNPTAGGR
jgi:hypothetical protein